MAKYMSSPGWLGTSIVTAADLIGRTDNVVCGVDYASGPDRTGLTYLVPNEGAHEIRDAADAERLFGKYSAAYDLAMRGLAAVEPDDTLRTRLARECAWADRYRVATATDADLDALAEKYGLSRTSPVAPKTKDADPTLRIYDATGCVLAEGSLRAQRTAMGARLHFAGQCCATGTAECYAVYANGKQVTWGQMGRGVRPLHMTQALSSGLYLTIALDVNDASEEQLQALGVAAEPKASVGPLPSLADAMRDDLGNDPAQWFARGRRATPPLFGGGESAFCVFVANLKAYDARERKEKAERRQREAALVALVNAVPEGFDANGWRSASIAVAESFSRLSDRDRPHPEEWGQRLAMTIAHPPKEWPFPGSWMQAALAKGLDAYQRAIAPHKAPAPERRRGGKAVRLTVDDGRDE